MAPSQRRDTARRSPEDPTLHTCTDSLAVASAEAVFKGGRSFTEFADATPENVHFGVRPHFPRVALTRAKARALRDALNIGLVALEELGDLGDVKPDVRHD